MTATDQSSTTLFFALRRFTKVAYGIRGIGLGRLCEAVRRYASRRAPAEPIQIDDFRGSAKFLCYLRDHMGGQIFFRGSYSGNQLSVLERHLKRDSIFVDVGANQGEFSIAAARIATNGKVIAFEPVSEYRNRLEENSKLNGFDNIVIVPVALADAEAKVPIYDADGAFSDGTRNDGVTSLYESKNLNRVREYVTVRRMDDVLQELQIDRVDIVKLDIEGGEWSALKGALETLKRYRPVLIFEVGSETCRAAGYEASRFVQWIEELGYRLEYIDDTGRTRPIDVTQLQEFQNVIAYPV
jgi:FkbM family methyltransferase